MYRQQLPALRIRPYRPRLEILEDRNLLSTYRVDHLADDLVGDGLNGSLRYCITHATDGDTIQFGVTGTINLSFGLPNLTHSISIEGPGANSLTVRRDTGGYYGIFTVGSGTAVRIAGMTIANGFVNGGIGGGIYNDYGTLTVSNSTISGNSAYEVCPFDYCYGGFGGGIYNDGTVTLNNSTVSGNFADYVGGGGIFNSGTVTLNNSTVSGNSADGNGGGIYISGGTLTVNNSTISGNTGTGGGIWVNGGALHARNTIIASNIATTTAPDLSGNLGSLGHNLIGNTQGGTGFDDTDLLNVNPLLGPLQDNGGPTQTMALLPGSPAIDAGDNSDAPDWDQRGPGFPRIVGIIDPDNPVIDIGAFEVQDGGNRPGRFSMPGVKPVRLDVAVLLETRPSQPLSGMRSETKPDLALVDTLFANDSAVQPSAAVGPPAMMDVLTPSHRLKGSRQDLAQADTFDLFGAFLAD
jgi:hypothetical protein